MYRMVIQHCEIISVPLFLFWGFFLVLRTLYMISTNFKVHNTVLLTVFYLIFYFEFMVLYIFYH